MFLIRKLKLKFLVLLLGLVAGFMLATLYRVLHGIDQETHEAMNCNVAVNSRALTRKKPLSPPSPKNFIYIGVMTAQKYLATRAVAVNRTWARSIPGQVNFYSSATSVLDPELNLPIVRLQGVDDSYPPQKKAFMMLKHMHDNFIDKFEWFMRADDDVYVRGDRLERFLRSVNSSKPQYIGHAGIGRKHELGLLHLNKEDNYCMGGPGMIFSRETLRRVVPHISRCLKNLWSTHEDVEVGRCIKQFVDIYCTWAYEMHALFYQDYWKPDNAFTRNLETANVHNAITLHPNKNPPYMYRLHNYLQSMTIMDLHMKTVHLHRHISEMEQLLNEDEDEGRISGEKDPRQRNLGLQPGLLKYAPDSHEDFIPWNFFDKRWYSIDVNNPRQTIPRYQRDALNNVARQVIDIINVNSPKGARTVNFKEIRNGYSRVVPHFGVDYVLDLNTFHKKQSEKPVSRRVYLQQSFGKIETRMGTTFGHARRSFQSRDHSAKNQINSEHSDEFFVTRRKNGATDTTSTTQQHGDINLKTVNLVLPLAGRLDTFRRFIENFERICLAPGENVKLIIVLFKVLNSDPSDEIENLIAKYSNKYPEYEITILHANGTFSRGIALNLGASYLPAEALMFILDVDMHILPGILTRCRLNTRQGEQIYYPVMFSQYSPEVTYGPRVRPESRLTISKETGFFRHYSYGMVCLYNSDLARVGGFITSIIGWGLEDVDLCRKLVFNSFTILHAPDPALIHIYHPVVCDLNLKSKQYQMCIGSKLNQYGSNRNVVRILEKETLDYSITDGSKNQVAIYLKN